MKEQDTYELEKIIESFREWYFLVKLREDCYTIPRERWNDKKHIISHQHYISKMLVLLLKQFVGNPEKKSVVDIGCNCGWLSFMLAEYGFKKIVGYDIYDHFIKQANFLLEYKKMENVVFTSDILSLENEDNFNIVFAFGVFNHVDHPLAFLEHLYRLTKEYLFIDCNCFIPSQSEPFKVGESSVSEATLGCNFVPNFDSSPGFSFETQYSKEAIINYLYRAGFSSIYEIPAPLSQPVKLGYYNNRFCAVAKKNDDPNFWQRELEIRQMYEKKAVSTYIDDSFFVL